MSLVAGGDILFIVKYSMFRDSWLDVFVGCIQVIIQGESLVSEL